MIDTSYSCTNRTQKLKYLTKNVLSKINCQIQLRQLVRDANLIQWSHGTRTYNATRESAIKMMTLRPCQEALKRQKEKRNHYTNGIMVGITHTLSTTWERHLSEYTRNPTFKMIIKYWTQIVVPRPRWHCARI